jgi:hypothetical protein
MLRTILGFFCRCQRLLERECIRLVQRDNAVPHGVGGATKTGNQKVREKGPPGDLVLTDLRSASSRLGIAEDVAGRLYIRNDRGVLAVELNKVEGQRVELGLEPGTYGIILDAKSGRSGTQLRISSHQSAFLSLSSLHPVSVDPATARGNAADAENPAADNEAKSNNPVAAAAALGAAVGAAVGTAVATAITTTVDAVSGRQPPDQGGESVPTHDPQPQEPEYAPFHFTLFPDLSDGVFASRSNHSFIVNLLLGTSSSSRGSEVGGLANFESRNVSGFQVAGLGNVVLGDADGFQMAGLVNVVGGETQFFQVAGLANVTLGDLNGAQTAGLANLATGEVRGAQIAGLLNWSKVQVNGAQMSGIANWSPLVHGPQISLVNVADTVSGAQVGLINIAGHVTGAQIGLVNVSREIDGVPIGLVSIEERGRKKIDVWWDTDGSVNGAISLGSRYFYTVFSAGWVPNSQPAAWTLGAGLGFHAPLGKFFVDTDLCVLTDQEMYSSTEQPSVSDIHPRLRAVLGVPIFGELAITGGFELKMNIANGITSTSTTYLPALIFGMQI